MNAVITGHLLATLDMIESKCLSILSVGKLSDFDARWVGEIVEECRRSKGFPKYAEENFDQTFTGIPALVRGYREHCDREKAVERRAERISEVVEPPASS